MDKAQRLAHAKHNEAVSKFLDKKPENADWVITTCFYAALHFVQYALFPLKLKTQDGQKFTVKSLDEWANNNNPKGLNRHQQLSDLVGNEFPKELSAAYDQLKDLCWTARYRQHQQTRALS